MPLAVRRCCWFSTERAPTRLVGEQIVEVAAVFGIEHLVGGGEAALAHGADVHLADGDDAVQKVGGLVGAGLVQHPLVARARRARLVGVDARDDDELFGELLLQGHEAGDVFADGVLVVGRAGPDDDDEFIRFAREYVADGGVARGLDCGELRREGELRLEFVRRGERRVFPHRHSLFLRKKCGRAPHRRPPLSANCAAVNSSSEYTRRWPRLPSCPRPWRG